MLGAGVSSVPAGRRLISMSPKSEVYGFRCPACGHHQSRVIDTRASAESIRRRRRCEACRLRFTTYEMLAVESWPVQAAQDAFCLEVAEAVERLRKRAGLRSGADCYHGNHPETCPRCLMDHQAVDG